MQGYTNRYNLINCERNLFFMCFKKNTINIKKHLPLRVVYIVLQIDMLDCKFFVSTGEPHAFQTLNNHNGSPGCNVHFDLLKFGPSAPKN